MKQLSITIVVALFTLHWVFAQGSLTPPGPPGPTFKTLQQVEPRVVVNGTNTPGDANNLFIISQPGSYYLTSNVTGVAAKHGIGIAASGVTLDLMGFEVVGVAGALRGINVDPSLDVTNVVVRNGSVRQWEYGISLEPAFGAQVEKLLLVNNALSAVFAGRDCLVRHCTARSNGTGIEAYSGIIQDCRSEGNGGDGISVQFDALVVNCAVNGNQSYGINLGPGSSVLGCTALANTGVGISTDAHSTVKNCSVIGNQSKGISAGRASVVGDCLAESNSETGIEAGIGSVVRRCAARGNAGDGISTSAGSTVEECSVSANHSGVASTSGCTIRDCTVLTNTLDGIQVGSHCQVLNNTATGNGNSGAAATQGGIHATGDRNRIDGNHSFGNNADGILVNTNATKNFVVRNTSGGNVGFQFRVPGIPGIPPDGANVVGPVVNDATNSSANAWANIQQF